MVYFGSFLLGWAMARSALRDFLHDSNFWLFDVAPIDALSLPIFLPLSGFNSISAPELTLETTTVVEGNNPYPTHVVKSAEVGPISLTRGVTFYDSDFWRWMTAAVSGSTGSGSSALGGALRAEVGGVTYRRSLLLVHFFRNFGINPWSSGSGDPPSEGYRDGVAVGGAIVGGGAISAATGATLGLGAGIAAGANLTALELWNGLAEGGTSVRVPARAFLLENCIPTRYKMGSDFDASSGQVSIAELEVHPEYVEEIALAA